MATITVNASVDSQIDSISLSAQGLQGKTLAKNGTATWSDWVTNTAYVPTFTGVATGYTGWWEVSKSGKATLVGGVGDSIVIPENGYDGCSLRFFGEENSYTKPDGTEGSETPDDLGMTYEQLYGSLPVIEEEGYTFLGWWTEPSGKGTQIFNDTVVSQSETVLIYANMAANTYYVTLDQVQGAGGTESVTAVFGSAMPSATMPTRTNYAFGGYWSEPNGGGARYYNADGTSARNWDIAADTTLYAAWTEEGYSVTLDAQGGVGGTLEVSAEYGQPMPTVTIPVYTGKTFGGYWSEPNGGGTQYYNADGTSAREWDKQEGATLYAKWLGNDYSVVLDSQGGSGGTSGVTATFGESMPSIESNLPSRAGYDFAGYFSGKNGTGTQYYNADGTSAHDWDFAGSKTLYAKWTGSEYVVTLNDGGGSGGTDTVTATYGSAMSPVTVPTKPGNTFAGYYENSDGTGTKYYDEFGTSAHVWDKNSATTIYAVWNPWTLYVRYKDCGDLPSSRVDEVTYNNGLVLPVAPSRKGGTFSKWDFNGTVFDAGGEIGGQALWAAVTSNLQTVFVKGVWEPITYEIQFNANDGTGTMAKMTDVTYGSYKRLTRNAFTRDGYEFVEWNTKANGKGNAFSDGADGSFMDVAGGSSVMLYAIWRESGEGGGSDISEDNGTEVTPTADVTIAQMPNQIFSRTYEGVKYTFHLRTFNGMMYADIAIDDEDVASGVRCVGGAWLVPQHAADAAGGGNFKFETLGDAYPWYEDFGETCKLEYYNPEAYLAARAE